MSNFLSWLRAFFLCLVCFPFFAIANEQQAGIKPHFVNVGEYKVAAQSTTLLRLVGHVPHHTRTSQRLTHIESDKVLNLTIGLRLNHEDQLDQFLAQVHDPSHPNFNHYMSSEEFIARFSPTTEEVNKVKEYFHLHGLKVLSVESNRLFMHVSGSAAEIQNAFHTELHYYAGKSGTFFAPSYELQVAHGLTIQSVHGLENVVTFHHHHVFKPVDSIEPLGTGQGGGLSPSDITTAYGHNSALDGSGQILAVFELDGYTASDIAGYENYYKLPHVPLQNILVDGVTGAPGNSGGPVEVTLDIELMVALAPNAAKIMVYEGPNTGEGVIDTYNKIATDNLAKSISTSWGSTESQSNASFLQSESNIFKQMGAQGQSIFAASGDSGAFDDDTTLSVDDPGSSPYVVSVGGTKLSTNNNGSYLSETTWNSTGNSTPGGGAGGGGISQIWPIPDWQKGAITTASKGSLTMRNVPDVSLNADPATGYSIFVSGAWGIVGGTSCAAPLWAAFTALVNQNRATTGLAPIGALNPVLYPLAQTSAYNKDFHDIKDGSTNKAYPAIAGYDLATGWGSFNITPLSVDLSGQSAPSSNWNVWVTPNSPSYSRPSRGLSYATITVQAQSATKVISGAMVKLTITAPNGTLYVGNSITNLSGKVAFRFALQSKSVVGTYGIKAVTTYKGKQASGTGSFIVHDPTF